MSVSLPPPPPLSLRPTIDWRRPDYKPIFAYRTEALSLLRNKRGVKKVMMAYYATHWTEFINDWMVTFDPRNVNSPLPTSMPFILFPRQEDFVYWIYARWQKRERGLAEKSRDVGFSWLACACAVCVWLFHNNANISFGSRKKESVDNGIDDPDSLFWKIRTLIEQLPKEFIPREYGVRNKWGLVVNQETNATIKGEVGDNIGMGARTTLSFIDEADSLEHQQLAEISLAGTTDCRIDISTTNNVGSVYYNNRRSLPEHQIFVFDWTQDPRKRLNPSIPPTEEPWYRKKKREMTPTAFASQVERNPNAALANSFVENRWVQNAFDRPVSSVQQPEDVPWSLGLDASGMGDDANILCARKGRICLPLFDLGKLDGVQSAMKVEEVGKDLLKTGPLALIAIERDGPGGSCADQLKYGPFARIVRAIHTGNRVSDGKNYNLRAWLHAQALEYLKENDPAIPYDSTFLSQGTGLLFEYKGGLLLIESKKDYRKRLSGARTLATKMAGKSPDRWDSFILTFTPPMGDPIRQFATPYSPSSPSWKPLDAAFGY